MPFDYGGLSITCSQAVLCMRCVRVRFRGSINCVRFICGFAALERHKATVCLAIHFQLYTSVYWLVCAGLGIFKLHLGMNLELGDNLVPILCLNTSFRVELG